jgi:hypothetical protein
LVNIDAGECLNRLGVVILVKRILGRDIGKYQIISGTGAYQGATGGGSIDGDWGDKSPLKGAGLYNIELDVKTPGM